MITGSASGYGLDGAALADKSEMVVIVAQYRLGILGFLKAPASNSTNALTGNYGLKDLVMALSKYMHIYINLALVSLNRFKPDH